MKFSTQGILEKSKEVKKDLITVAAIIGFLLFVIFIYSNFFKSTSNIPKINSPKTISGEALVSSEISEVVVNRLKRDMSKMQDELNNEFYSKLRVFQPSGGATLSPGRDNPFIR